jgi:thiamine biosynthesis protein ThiS
MADISIILNGEPRQIAGGLALDELIDYFSLPRQRVAVEHNGQVVRRSDWALKIVSQHDRIEVVHFVGGG